MRGMAVFAASAACLIAAAAALAGEPPSTVGAGPAHGLAHSRGQAHGGHGGGGGGTPLLTFHGGQIMTSAAVTPIFWGTSWSRRQRDSPGARAVLRRNRWLSLPEHQHRVHRHEWPGRNCSECRRADHRQLRGAQACAPDRRHRGRSREADPDSGCERLLPGVHRSSHVATPATAPGTAGRPINGVLTQFAFFFKLDGDPGCDPNDTQTGHSEGLAALANVSGHELSEALTDPHGDGWLDNSGAENADKCAWTFSGTPENLGGTAGRSRATSATPRPLPTAATTARAASTASDRHSMGRGRDPASPHRSPGAVSRSSRKCSSMTAQFSIGWNGSSLTCERRARIVPPCETTSRRSPG